MSPRNHSVALAESQHHVINPTNPRRALDDGVEHRLHVRRRAADDAEHLGRCRLMLQASRSSALRSCNSLNSRTFSMAITAWSAKVSRRAICLSVNGRTSVRRIMIAPIGNTFAQQRRGQHSPMCRICAKPGLQETRLRLRCKIMNMNLSDGRPSLGPARATVDGGQFRSASTGIGP